MAYVTNNKANEEISKFKLLSAYGGPGSIIHTEYGSIIISCIEEWGFIQKIGSLRDAAIKLGKDEKDEFEYVTEQAKLIDIELSNDVRLLHELMERKKMIKLKYLPLIPDIELNYVFNTIKDGKTSFAINSTFMPKGFFNGLNLYKQYKDWYKDWKLDAGSFFPPMQNGHKLKQDNIILICDHGHLTDFPWSRYLRWRIEKPDEQYDIVDLFNKPFCCENPLIQVKDTSANASGFDGKWLKCNNASCAFTKGVSLKGLMSVKILCPGHKPWEVPVGDTSSYYGNNESRRKTVAGEKCNSRHMKVTLTTGNNIYFSRILSSIYMPVELFLSEGQLKLKRLKGDLVVALKNGDYKLCDKLDQEIKSLEKEIVKIPEDDTASDAERELKYRYIEFKSLSLKSEAEINLSKDLKIVDVTRNLSENLNNYFSRILRIDNLKITSTQLDFSRVEPTDAESSNDRIRKIFRSEEESVLIYPVVENYGEGIFFAFNEELITKHATEIARFNKLFNKPRNDFASGAVIAAKIENWQLYLVHTFCHLIMRELEFRCGYPTASLSERLYSSNSSATKMHGCLIYTAEGAEGSMGGLIAQTRKGNLNDLILSALTRATVCNSDPLCWESDGQGLFELNLASCFSCSLVSETSCEKRNIYLDRRILVDNDLGFFKALL